MRTRPSMHILAGGALAVLVGCTSTTTTTDTAAPTSSAAPVTTAPATTTTQDKKSDEKIAKKAVLTLEDLTGSGWDERKSSTTNDNSDGELADSCKDIADQLDVFTKLTKDAPKAKSPVFANQKQQRQVNSEVMVLANEDQATTLANALGDASMLRCLKQYMQDSAAKDTSAAKIDPDKIDIERSKVGKLGDDHAVFTIDVPVAQNGATVSVTLVLALIRVGRAYTNVTYTSATAIELETDVLPILETAVEKLQKNLAT